MVSSRQNRLCFLINFETFIITVTPPKEYSIYTPLPITKLSPYPKYQGACKHPAEPKFPKVNKEIEKLDAVHELAVNTICANSWNSTYFIPFYT